MSGAEEIRTSVFAIDASGSFPPGGTVYRVQITTIPLKSAHQVMSENFWSCCWSRSQMHDQVHTPRWRKQLTHLSGSSLRVAKLLQTANKRAQLAAEKRGGTAKTGALI